jgi:TonB family protein
MAAMRKLSDINIGHSQVVAPAPQLPVNEQHALPNLARASLENSAAAVVPPPPTTQGVGSSSQEGRLIALSVNPAPPTAPVEVPSGNRRGAFAATPEGKPGATGAPAKPEGNSHLASAIGVSGSGKNVNGIPPGLFVGPGPKTQATSPVSGQPSGSDPKASSADPPLLAHATSPRILASEMSPEQQSEAERKVFGARKSYSMTLNLPNLNSAGGSLVMHFSELQESTKQGDLFAPVVTRAVAPGYPLELMRENVQGTVELSAVIRSDGSVGDVRVLSDVDDRLEAYARDALLRWQFLPALRNGNPVALQAVVRIPFKPRTRF